MKRPVVGVFFGSRSAEHDVSVVTAISSIIKPLELSEAFDVVPVYITKSGEWYSGDELKDITLFSSGKIDSWLKKHKPVLIDMNVGLRLVHPKLKNRSVNIDIAFPAMHGTFGEDGTLMGVFEMAGIPYVGCGVAASSLAMDKVLAKEVASGAGVPTNEYFWFTAAEFKRNQADIVAVCRKMRYPLFVKPAHLGSSIAITRVTNETELVNAIEVAAYYDDKILVEEGVNNLVEVTVPIMGNDKLVIANTEEPIQGDEFFDFDTKYMKGGKKGGKSGGAKTGSTSGAQGYSHIPARLSDTMNDKCKEIAANVYRSLGCTGIARVDLLIDGKTKKIYFNEVNPLPGSLYAHNWRSAGISSVELVKRLVGYAQERGAVRTKLATTFDTNFLKQF
jgi:D-alanine-D-alanine ligase